MNNFPNLTDELLQNHIDAVTAEILRLLQVHEQHIIAGQYGTQYTLNSQMLRMHEKEWFQAVAERDRRLAGPTPLPRDTILHRINPNPEPES